MPRRRVIILLLISVGLSVFAIYTYWSVSKKTDKFVENLKSSGQSVNNSNVLIEKVSRLVLLPKNEFPSIATINNLAQLQKESSFYDNARKGDILLIYFQARKAYIYDPVENIIINMGPVSVEKKSVDVSVVSSTTSTP
jgi:hypothetical protein